MEQVGPRFIETPSARLILEIVKVLLQEDVDSGTVIAVVVKLEGMQAEARELRDSAMKVTKESASTGT